MKKLFLILMICFSGIMVYSQATKDSTNKEQIKTIFGNKKITHGGYGAFSVGYTNIDNKDGFITGGRGAWIIGHCFALGIGGSGFGNNYFLENKSGSDVKSITGGYGGLILEPIVLPKFPVHLSFPVLLGVGGVASVNSHYYDFYDQDYTIEDSDVFLMVEPAAELELNLLKHLRLTFGLSYRFAKDVQLFGYKHDVLNGYSIFTTLKFGKF